MVSSPTPDGGLRLTRTEWLICVIAAIGFAFDIYELLMLPLIVRPALEQLGGIKFGSPEFAHWRDLLLFSEYFHGDTGAGLGASHQTGWTGLVAKFIELYGRVDAKSALEGGKMSGFRKERGKQ